MITAPFNFVPLNEKVFYPPWADDVSHDIPFEDGESGVIDITITAKSPIFIRDHEKPEEFCQHNGTYYIPGSSVKGMVRNVLEIMSFSKMSFVDDKTYAVRDLGNPELYRNHFKSDKIFCGWFRKDLDTYVIDDCGYPARISHNEIDKLLNTNFNYEFSDGFDGSNESSMKNAEYKYSLAGDKNSIVKVQYKKKNNVGQEVYIKPRESSENDVKTGTLVFTGQPTQRKNSGKPGDGKGFEFVFFERKNTISLKKEVFENFKFAYFDGRKTEPKESPDWKYWKEKLYNGGRVPVFFRKDKDGEVLDFGLSYLYKLPYKHSIIDGIPRTHISVAPIADLAETIFGYTHFANEALKGRVQFSHFKVDNVIESNKEVTLILGTPRASYYPLYIVQEKEKRYKTYMDDNFKIKGWKRYPIHKNQPSHQNEEKSSVTTTFKPLLNGTVFKGKVRFHNLKHYEIGALISALTFHNHEECFHNIGLAKPYGYGKIELKIDNIDLVNSKAKTTKEYMQQYEELMESFQKNWINSIQIKTLLTMAKEQNIHFKYMTLRPNNEFVKNKQTGNNVLDKKHYQTYILEIDNIQTVELKSLLSKDFNKRELKGIDTLLKDIDFIKRYQYKDHSLKKLLENFKRKYPNNETFDGLLKDFNKKIKIDPEELAWRATISSNNLYDYERFIEKYPNSIHVSKAKDYIEKQKIEIEKQKLQEEASAKWEEIKNSQNIKDFNSFIEKYKISKEVELAERKIVDLENAKRKEKEREKKQEEAKKQKHKERQNFGNIINSFGKKKKK